VTTAGNRRYIFGYHVSSLTKEVVVAVVVVVGIGKAGEMVTVSFSL
jgi:hypothetical protein